MSLFDKIKCSFYRIKEHKKYKGIESCDLLFPFFNKKGPLIEWVQYVKEYNRYSVEQNVVLAIGYISRAEVIYHYKALLYGTENSSQKAKYRFMVSHLLWL